MKYSLRFMVVCLAAAAAPAASAFSRALTLQRVIVTCGVGVVVCGLWFVVCGLWFVVCGLWFVIYDL
jgi:hypothetical protein